MCKYSYARIHTIYHSLMTNQSNRLDTPIQFSRYMQWIEKQDKEAARQYWSQYLVNYEHQASVSRTSGKAEQRGIELEGHVFRLDRELTRGLEQVAREAQVTVNTVMQTIWGRATAKV
ncbi:condensation domain-containing protein [Paenibacillus amylolyticus]